MGGAGSLPDDVRNLSRDVVPYTEFKSQVAGKNVAEVFARGDSIEGQLRKAVSVPGKESRSYQQFTTERPTFASDNLLAELTDGGATVRATPLVQRTISRPNTATRAN